jgi:hypothetical protein
VKYLINIGIWIGIYIVSGFIIHFLFDIYTPNLFNIYEFLIFLIPSIGLILLRFKNNNELLGQTIIVLICVLVSSISTKTVYSESFSYLLLLSGITYAVLNKLLKLPALHLYEIKNRYKLYTLSVFTTSALNIIFKSI